MKRMKFIKVDLKTKNKSGMHVLCTSILGLNTIDNLKGFLKQKY